MVFNSLVFVTIFPIIIFLYYLIPEKVKNVFLFFVSLGFYACFKFSYIFLLLGVVGIVYISALLMEKNGAKCKKADFSIQCDNCCSDAYDIQRY